MSMTTESFWDATITASTLNAALRRKADHLIGYVIEFDICGPRYVFEFHRGAIRRLDRVPLSGAKSRLSGPSEEWLRVTRGDIPFIRAVNGLHGRLLFEGSAIGNTWASPALGEFFAVAAAANKGQGQ